MCAARSQQCARIGYTCFACAAHMKENTQTRTPEYETAELEVERPEDRLTHSQQMCTDGMVLRLYGAAVCCTCGVQQMR